MIKSMTGFGRCELSDSTKKITVELKSVNHRYLDVNIRMPKKLNLFEASIRNVLKEYAQRGKVDLFITYEEMADAAGTVKYNRALAKEYLDHLRAIAADFGLEDDIRTSTLSRYPEVLSMEEQPLDEDELWSLLEAALRKACEQFVETRLQEGAKLKEDLVSKLNHMKTNVDKVEERAPQIIAEYREKLNAKVRELLGDTTLEESRLSAEIIMFADKICTDEETVRLRSHIDSVLKTLDSNEAIGRKLDFIAQEMNRESNTILSKANDLDTSNIAIELKTEVEKIREQIQNIE